MLRIKSFTFNAFQENTYLIHDEQKNTLIIDPGMYTEEEKTILTDYVSNNELKLLQLLNTHCHIDHIFGNGFIYEKFHLKTSFHRREKPLIESASDIGERYGLPLDPAPAPDKFIEETDAIILGKYSFSTLLTPGHSPGSVCFYCKEEDFVIGGDVLFRESIGRTDLPGGNHQLLLQSIKEKLFTLPDETTVYPGHGPATTIGFEKQHNPFLH